MACHCYADCAQYWCCGAVSAGRNPSSPKGENTTLRRSIVLGLALCEMVFQGGARQSPRDCTQESAPSCTPRSGLWERCRRLGEPPIAFELVWILSSTLREVEPPLLRHGFLARWRIVREVRDATTSQTYTGVKGWAARLRSARVTSSRRAADWLKTKMRTRRASLDTFVSIAVMSTHQKRSAEVRDINALHKSSERI